MALIIAWCVFANVGHDDVWLKVDQHVASSEKIAESPVGQAVVKCRRNFRCITWSWRWPVCTSLTDHVPLASFPAQKKRPSATCFCDLWSPFCADRFNFISLLWDVVSFFRLAVQFPNIAVVPSVTRSSLSHGNASWQRCCLPQCFTVLYSSISFHAFFECSSFCEVSTKCQLCCVCRTSYKDMYSWLDTLLYKKYERRSDRAVLCRVVICVLWLCWHDSVHFTHVVRFHSQFTTTNWVIRLWSWARPRLRRPNMLHMCVCARTCKRYRTCIFETLFILLSPPGIWLNPCFLNNLSPGCDTALNWNRLEWHCNISSTLQLLFKLFREAVQEPKYWKYTLESWTDWLKFRE